jgi:hypothetical protein
VDGSESLDLPWPPPWLLEWIAEAAGPQKKAGSPAGVPKTRGTLIPTNDLIQEGSRNAGLTAIAGRFRHAGLGEDSIERELQEINRTRCVPPLSSSEVSAIAHSVSRYPAGSIPQNSQNTGLSREDLENFMQDQDSFDDEYIGVVAEEISMQDFPLLLGTPLNDTGNALRLYDSASVDFKFCEFWYSWSGSHWERDSLFRALERTRVVLEMLLRQASSIDGDVEHGEIEEKTDDMGKNSHDDK